MHIWLGGTLSRPLSRQYEKHRGGLVIVRVSRLRVSVRQRGDRNGQQRPHSVVALHHPVDDENRLGGLTPVALVDLRLDRHIDVAVLVLQREEADLPRGGRRLPGDDQARHLGFLYTEEELKPLLEGEIPPSKTRACAGRTWWGTCPRDRA